MVINVISFDCFILKYLFKYFGAVIYGKWGYAKFKRHGCSCCASQNNQYLWLAKYRDI